MAKKAAPSVSLGQRVRKMREEQNISLDALAHKIGYSPEYLAELESDKITPPVGALIQISRALQIDSSSLLSETKKKARKAGYSQRTKAYFYENLTPESADKHLWAYMITLEPKQEHERVVFKHEGEEFHYVIEGEVEVTVGETPHTIKRGDAFHFDSSQEHQLRNLSDAESKVLVVVYTP